MKTYSGYYRHKILYASQIIFVIFSVIFIIEKIVLPQSEDGLTQVPILVSFTLLGIYTFATIALGIFAYYSWRLDAIQLHDWNEAQDIFTPKWLKEWQEGVSKEYALWVARMGATIGFFFGAFMIYVFMQVIKALLIG